MLFYFRKLFSSHHASRLSATAAYLGANTVLIGSSVYCANQITDPEEKKIVMNNFLDTESCRDELYRLKKSKIPK